VAEIAHGVVRAIVWVPWLGEFRSGQLGVFTESFIILVIAYFTICWIGSIGATDLLKVGFLWLTLTVAFEIVVGRLVLGLAWEQIFASYNMAEGGLMPFGLLLLLFSPMITKKLREIRLQD
jgi:hypothetical protein